MIAEGCYTGCYYYTDSCFRKDCKQVNKTQREQWDEWVKEAYSVKDTINGNSLDDVMVAADVYIRKLERELQTLKNKKTMAALLMKKV